MKKKAKRYFAQYTALSNAAEFIRGHREEGSDPFEDEALEREYMKYKKDLAGQLDRRAQTFWEKYLALGIDINIELDVSADKFF